jgi:GTP-sensing pleiotropic transcriptional regulator CodY
MREGGKRRIVVPPGPLQQQGTKSLVWMVGLLDALEDAGGVKVEGLGVKGTHAHVHLQKLIL